MINKQEVKKQIGLNIKKVRLLRGITQDELAEQLGVTPRYVNMLERSNRNMTVETLVRVANCLKVDLISLVSNDYQRDVSVLIRMITDK